MVRGEDLRTPEEKKYDEEIMAEVEKSRPVFQWVQEYARMTGHLSFLDMNHPSVKKILDLGEYSVGPLLTCLHRDIGDPWMVIALLMEIFPDADMGVTEEDAGKLDRMRDKILTWATGREFTCDGSTWRFVRDK